MHSQTFFILFVLTAAMINASPPLVTKSGVTRSVEDPLQMGGSHSSSIEMELPGGVIVSYGVSLPLTNDPKELTQHTGS